MSTVGAHTDLVRRRRWTKRYRYDRSHGVSHAPVPAEPVREHVRRLLDAGFTATSIARAAGVPHDTVLGVAYGFAKNREPGRATLQRRTAARLRRVTARACIEQCAPTQLVPKTGAARRVRALQAIGWTVPQIAEAAPGMTFHQVRTVLYERPRSNGEPERVARSLHDAICVAYDKLSMTPGGNKHTLTVAKREGYPPPLAWDDDVLDEPDAQPDYGVGAVGMSRDDVAWLAQSMRTWDALVERTGKAQNYLRTALQRTGRLDIVDRLDIDTYGEKLGHERRAC